MKIKRFNEANLNIQQLDDVRNGEVRGQKLVTKLRNDGDFTVAPKNKPEKTVNFENPDEIADNIVGGGDQYDSSKARNFFMTGKNYKKILKGEDEVDYKLNDLKKDEYFGSSGGSSLGFDKTRRMESLQCIFLSLKQYLINVPRIHRLHIRDLFDQEGNIDPEIMRYVNIPIEIDAEYIQSFIDDVNNQGWIDTFLNTANSLYRTDLQLVGKNKRTVFKPEKKYNFHQIGSDTPFIKTLIEVYDQSPESKKIPISKWTPSDIWAVDSRLEARIISQMRQCDNLKDLNSFINSKFMRSQLIGVSLKKIGGAESIKLVINKLTPPPKYTFDKVITSSDPKGSMGVKLVAKFTSEVLRDGVDTMYLRSFSGGTTISNISGEVEGQYSRYGKIGLEWINRILSECGILEDDLIPTKKKIVSDTSFTDEFLTSEINRMNGIVGNKSRTTDKKISGRGSLVSKYQALRFAVLINDLRDTPIILNEEDEVKRNYTSISDKIIEDMFYYAMSINNYNFECPMYVRIVSNKSQ
jgi:hypothetical protein